MSISARALKRRLSIEDYKKVCAQLDIPVYEENEREIKYWTGDKNKNALKGSPGKLVFYKNTKIYFGYTAGCSYDIISLTQKRLNLLGRSCSFVDAVKYISDVCNIATDTIERQKPPDICNWQQGLEKFIRFKKTGIEYKFYDPSILKGFDPIFPQEWIDGGISPDSLIKYQVGYYTTLHATTLPVFEKYGYLLGIRVRNWLPEEIEKGKYRPLTILNGKTFSFPTNSTFYGINYNWPEIQRTKTVVLGEGEKFVLKADTWFKERNVALGMFGNNLGLYRRNMLLRMGVNRVIYVVDNDYIGKDDSFFSEWEKRINKFINLWSGLAQVEIVWDSGLGLLGPKDNAMDYTKEIFNELYKKRLVC